MLDDENKIAIIRERFNRESFCVTLGTRFENGGLASYFIFTDDKQILKKYEDAGPGLYPCMLELNDKYLVASLFVKTHEKFLGKVLLETTEKDFCKISPTDDRLKFTLYPLSMTKIRSIKDGIVGKDLMTQFEVVMDNAYEVFDRLVTKDMEAAAEAAGQEDVVDAENESTGAGAEETDQQKDDAPLSDGGAAANMQSKNFSPEGSRMPKLRNCSTMPIMTNTRRKWKLKVVEAESAEEPGLARRMPARKWVAWEADDSSDSESAPAQPIRRPRLVRNNSCMPTWLIDDSSASEDCGTAFGGGLKVTQRGRGRPGLTRISSVPLGKFVGRNCEGLWDVGLDADLSDSSGLAGESGGLVVVGGGRNDPTVLDMEASAEAAAQEDVDAENEETDLLSSWRHHSRMIFI